MDCRKFKAGEKVRIIPKNFEELLNMIMLYNEPSVTEVSQDSITLNGFTYYKNGISTKYSFGVIDDVRHNGMCIVEVEKNVHLTLHECLLEPVEAANDIEDSMFLQLLMM